jgi:hypothetical protein
LPEAVRVPGRVISVDSQQRTLSVLSDGQTRELHFDRLALATGAWIALAGESGWERFSTNPHGPLASRIRVAFEYAESEPDPVERTRLLTFAVVGGGPVAECVATSIAELAGKMAPAEFAETLRVILASDGPADLPGIDVRLGAPKLRADGLSIDGDHIPAGIVVRADGLRPAEAAAWAADAEEVHTIGPAEAAGTLAGKAIRRAVEAHHPRRARVMALEAALQRVRREFRSLRSPVSST